MNWRIFIIVVSACWTGWWLLLELLCLVSCDWSDQLERLIARSASAHVLPKAAIGICVLLAAWLAG